MIEIKQKFTPEQLNIINSLAERCGLLPDTAKILYSRGIDTENKVARFLSPGKKHFADPFTLRGIREACERISAARDNGERVVIYGDYDADGVCASSIMYFALKEYGVDAVAVLPERNDGYGLSEHVIDKVMERYDPDLIITVDCGISGYKEVEYVKDLGVDIIVTDHHELPEILPDCITVNCKLPNQEYGFDSLCGAGVAFKLATALIGKSAYSLLDFAALATVADSMPLVDENRDIVFEGLKLISGPNCRMAFRALIEASKVREFNSTALAYSLAPRINAAGRMGDAALALRLFLSDNRAEIFELAAKLNEYNMERQAQGEELYASAKAKLAQKGAYKRVIVLEDDGWKNGLVGIAASKLVEEFCRPVVMLVRHGNVLHGSARSVEGINVLDAIAHNREFLIEYGGHSQAAGVTLSADKLEAFENGMHEYISSKYGDEVFRPKFEAECYIEGKFPLEFAREIERLEPFGTGNKRPMFACDSEILDIRPLKSDSPHLSIATENIDLLYFGGVQNEELLRSPAKKTFVFETNLSVFNGRESLKGYVRSFETEILPTRELGLELYMKNLRMLRRSSHGASAEYVSQSRIEEIIEESLSCPYGTMFVAGSLRTLDKFPKLKGLPVNLGRPPYTNVCNCIVLALSGGDISGYRRIVFLDDPLTPVRRTKRAEVYVNEDIQISRMLPEISATREGVGEVFSLIKNCGNVRAANSRELYEEIAKTAQITRYQFVFGAEVLEELGIISYENGRMIYDRRAKSDLGNSRIFRKISER